MIELSQLDDHIKTLKSAGWAKLFNLLDEMSKSPEFGVMKGARKLPDEIITLPFYDNTVVVQKFLHVVNELNIVPRFDWPEWIEGKKMLNSKAQIYNELDVLTLCKLLTVAIRADRFTEGFLVSCFERGVIQKIVIALKDKIRPE